MRNDDLKPSMVVAMDISVSVKPEVTGTLRTTRSGVLINTQQSFSIPKGDVKIGDMLVHRVSGATFVVLEFQNDQYVLKDISNEKQTTADTRTVKQSCWLLAETAKEGI